MKLREVEEGKEIIYTDDITEIHCPVCSKIIATNYESNPDEYCEHVMFSFLTYDQVGFNFVSDKIDEKELFKAFAETADEDSVIYLFDTIEAINIKGIDYAIYKDWKDEPTDPDDTVVWGICNQ